jgi:hypothetical protein
MKPYIFKIFLVLALGLFILSSIGICSSSSSSSGSSGSNIYDSLSDSVKAKIKLGDIIYGDGNSVTGHVGIVIGINENAITIREAMPNVGVADIDLKDFLGRDYKRVLIFNVTKDEQKAKAAAEVAKNIKGVYLNPNNEVNFFTLSEFPTCSVWCDDSRWYCSKLVFKAYERVGVTLCPYERICVTPAGIYNMHNSVVAYWDGEWKAGSSAPSKLSDNLGSINCYYKVLYCGCHCTNAGVPDWTGKWGSTFGDMDLKQNGAVVTGTYRDGAKREGWITDGRAYNDQHNTYLTGNWNEKGRSGPFTFVLGSEGKTFTGEWKYGNHLSWAPGIWNGWRN